MRPKEQSPSRMVFLIREREQTERALFVIDAEGIIRWYEVVSRAVNPGAHGILAALEE